MDAREHSNTIERELVASRAQAHELRTTLREEERVLLEQEEVSGLQYNINDNNYFAFRNI